MYFLSRPPFRRLWWLERLFIARQDWDKNHIAAHQPHPQAQAHRSPPQAQPWPLFQPLANNYFLSGCSGSSVPTHWILATSRPSPCLLKDSQIVCVTLSKSWVWCIDHVWEIEERIFIFISIFVFCFCLCLCFVFVVVFVNALIMFERLRRDYLSLSYFLSLLNFCLLFLSLSFVFVNGLIMFERLSRGGVDTDAVFVTLRHIRLHFVILFLPTHHLPWLLFSGWYFHVVPAS